MIKIGISGENTGIRIASAILWPSFIFAGLASMLFFASFDPHELAYLATFPFEITPTEGYTIGFILFWLLGIINIAGAFFLIRVIDIDFK